MAKSEDKRRRLRAVILVAVGLLALAVWWVSNAIQRRIDRINADFGAIHEGMSEVEAREILDAYNLQGFPGGEWRAERAEMFTYYWVWIRVEEGKVKEVKRGTPQLITR